MQKLKWVLIVLVSLFVGALLVILFPPTPYKNSLKSIAEGDFYFQSGIYNKALENYDKAQKQWFIVRFDKGVQQRSEKAKEELAKKVNITIFLKDTAKESEIQNLVGEIKALSGVRDVKYISKEEALRIYRERNKNEPELLTYVTSDILPSSIEVYLENDSIKDQITQLVNSKSFVEKLTLSN